MWPPVVPTNKPLVAHHTQIRSWLVITWMLGDIITISFKLHLKGHSYTCREYMYTYKAHMMSYNQWNVTNQGWKNIIKTSTMSTVVSKWLRVTMREPPVHAMNAEQHQTAADHCTKPTDFSHRPACRRLWNYIRHRRLLLLSLKADTHFTIPQMVEGWVDLDGWLHTPAVYLPSSSHPFK